MCVCVCGCCGNRETYTGTTHSRTGYAVCVCVCVDADTHSARQADIRTRACIANIKQRCHTYIGTYVCMYFIGI